MEASDVPVPRYSNASLLPVLAHTTLAAEYSTLASGMLLMNEYR